jgi:ribosomal protein S18 acetylase RimI-like enzyme
VIRNEIKRIERAAARALPAPETIEVDGWTVLLGRGEVNRINSAVTNGYRPRALMDHIEATERRFASRRRSPQFRLTPLDQTVDGLLSDRGYERSADVVVMTAPVATGAEPDPAVMLRSAVTPGFVDRFRAWGGYTDVRVDEIVESLSALTLPYVAALSDHALAVGVVDDGLVGLFDVVVDPDARSTGHGRTISRSVLAWGADRGAELAYLQVHSENAAALRLYRSLGFEEAYRYWYRSRATVPR